MKIHICILSAAAAILLAAPSAFADAKAVYTKNCANCHGADGKGDTKMGKKLKIKDMSVEQKKLSDAKIAQAIKEGASENGKVRMKPAKGLSDADIQDLVKYVRTL